MITRANARQMQQQVEKKFTRTRTFPPRFIATAFYRRQLTAEVDLLCDEQVNRIIDRLAMMDDRLPEIGDRMFLREYDCEVRR